MSDSGAVCQTGGPLLFQAVFGALSVYGPRVPKPLDGIRVIDTSTGPVGGIATMVLADFGAEVIKVEPPGGDRFRSLPGSPMWLRGKQSVVLDLHGSSGREQLHDLVSTADVLVVGGPPQRAVRWGIDAVGLVVRHPSLVHCSITGWGELGPMANVPAYVSTVDARSGRMLAFAEQIARPGPVYSALPVAGHMAAHGAVQGIISALIVRSQSGLGGRVTTSLLQALLPFDLNELLLVQCVERWGSGPIPYPANGSALPTLNYHPVMAKDGRWIQCGNLLEHLFLSFLDAIDLYGELLSDDRFIESPALWSPEAIEHARDRILETVQTKTADEWMAIFHANGNVAAEPFLTPEEALDHPDLVANGAIVEVNDPEHGPVRMIGTIATFSETPAGVTRPAPRLGEHTVALSRPVATEVTPDAPSANRSSVSIVHKGRPLHGVKVVEFASVIAAPLGTSMLADLGARVIRVEPIDGDSFRHLLPHGIMAVKTTAGKESICIDMKSEAGRSIARKLIAGADVVVHNYRLGVPERLGIGYDQLRIDHPRLIWVAVSGYGPNGPSAHRPATHPVAGASMGGAGYQAGSVMTEGCLTTDEIRESARQLMRANESNPDPNTSAIVASSVTLALLARERFGIGQSVHVDMLTANAHANADSFLAYDAMLQRPAVDANHYGTGERNRLYRCRTGWVFLTVTTDDEWRRFQDVAGAESDLVAVFATRDASEWEDLLIAVGVACVRADEATPGMFCAHSEQMLVNGFVPLATHARFGVMRRWGPIVSVDGGASEYGPGVLAGEHTDTLLAECGYGEDAIAQFRADGVVASEALSPFLG